MRTVDEIFADIHAEDEASGGTSPMLSGLWLEYYHTITDGILLDRLREICEAERAPDEWECMINAYGELEGFMHTKCGHQSQSATHYCSNCGHKMAIAEAEAALGEGDA